MKNTINISFILWLRVIPEYENKSTEMGMAHGIWDIGNFYWLYLEIHWQLKLKQK